MINANLRLYDFYTIGGLDEYGQRQQPTKDAAPAGNIKMAIYTTSQSIQENINYLGCKYIGLTQAEVKDTYVIDYEGKRLKVQYINAKGRFKQVYMVDV